jgi:hypothetical protein
MTYAFQKLELTGSDKIWLQAVVDDKESSDRELRIKLLNQLDEKFDPETLFRCLFYEGKKISLIGLWYLNPQDPIFKYIDTVINTIWNFLKTNPSLTGISANSLAEEIDWPVKRVENALGHINMFPKFRGGGKPTQDGFGYEWIYIGQSFGSVSAYKNYKSVFDEIDELFLKGYYRYDNSTTLNLAALGIASQPEILCAIEPNTAFIVMPIDYGNALLEEVNKVIKEVCQLFGIIAVRADDIEHSNRITDVVLKKIKTSQHIIADLSYERPNVYYEIGYAHAVGKHPILYCKEGTNLHFDLKDYNVPAYQGVLDLRDKLKKRFQEITGKSVE